jgi:hypothetical protein
MACILTDSYVLKISGYFRIQFHGGLERKVYVAVGALGVACVALGLTPEGGDPSGTDVDVFLAVREGGDYIISFRGASSVVCHVNPVLLLIMLDDGGETPDVFRVFNIHKLPDFHKVLVPVLSRQL